MERKGFCAAISVGEGGWKEKVGGEHTGSKPTGTRELQAPWRPGLPAVTEGRGIRCLSSMSLLKNQGREEKSKEEKWAKCEV